MLNLRNWKRYFIPSAYVPLKHMGIEDEEKYLREVFTEITEKFYFIPKNASDSDFERLIKKNTWKCFLAYFFSLSVSFFGIFGYFIVSVTDSRLRTETIQQLYHISEITVPLYGLLELRLQNTNIQKLVYELPRVRHQKVESLGKIVLGNARFQTYLESFKITGDKRYAGGMFTPMWFPFDIGYFPVEGIVGLLVLIGIVRYSMLFSYSSSVATTSSGWIKCRMRHLTELIGKTSLSQERDIRIVRKDLNDLIQYHAEIIEQVTLLEKVTIRLSTMNIIMFSPTIAVLLTRFAQEHSLIILSQILVQVTFSMNYTNAVSAMAPVVEDLSAAVYNMDWYDMDPKLKKHIPDIFHENPESDFL